MKPETVLTREPGDRTLAPSVFVKEHSERGGQRARYRLNIHSRADVGVARRAHLAVSLLDPSMVARLGYPLSFRPRLLIGEAESLALAESVFKTIVFHDEEAARNPTLEDTIVAMLSVDVLGARRISVENRTRIDGSRLLKRILREDAERLAYRVRLNEFAPGLPKPPGVEPISRATLVAEDRREFARGP
ncbi:MAG: hypothetical protein ACREDK_03285 [Thermoplasmata archaeon]